MPNGDTTVLATLRGDAIADDASMSLVGEVDGTPAPAPMRTPDALWAWWVTAVDLDPTDETIMLEGRWLATQQPADRLHDGDLVVRLTPPESGRDDRVTVEMLLAYHERWVRVGVWPDLGPDWPRVIGPTAAAIMSLHCDAAEVRPANDRAESTFGVSS